MKKYFIKIAFVAFFAAIAGYGVYANQETSTMSDLMLINVEALANGENGQKLDCWSTVSSNGNVLATHVTYCGSCSAVLAKSWSNKSMCNN